MPMKIAPIGLALNLLLATLLLGCTPEGEQAISDAAIPSGIAETPEPAPQEILVLAAASLTEALEPFESFAEEQLRAEITISLGGSQSLRTTLEGGNSADLFISADMDHIQALVDAELATDAFEFAHNRLALAVPKANPADIESLADIADEGVKVVLAVDSCPVGKYTRKLLDACEEQADLPPDFAEKVLANVVSEDANVKQVLSKVIFGAADAAFVYESDLTEDVRVNVIEIDIPEDAQQVATYAACIPRSAKNPDDGRDFMECLLSTDGRQAITTATPIEFIDLAVPPWTQG